MHIVLGRFLPDLAGLMVYLRNCIYSLLGARLWFGTARLAKGRLSVSLSLYVYGMTHLRIWSPHEEVVLLDQTVGSDVDSWLDKPED